jgi:hypothetical protein
MSDETSPAELPKWLRDLNEKQRAFVDYLFQAPPKQYGSPQVWALRQAGYGTPTSSAASLRALSGQLMAKEKIQHAIEQESRRRLRLLPPGAVASIEKILQDPEHKHFPKVVAQVFERTDPAPVKVEVEHTSKAPSPEQIEAVMQKIAQLAQKAGMPAIAPPTVIEGEFAEVKPESTP